MIQALRNRKLKPFVEPTGFATAPSGPFKVLILTDHALPTGSWWDAATFEVLRYIPAKRPKEAAQNPLELYKNELNWFNLPKATQALGTFDIVVNLASPENQPLDWYWYKVAAKLKVDFTGHQSLASISVPGDHPLEDKFKTLEHILNTLS